MKPITNLIMIALICLLCLVDARPANNKPMLQTLGRKLDALARQEHQQESRTAKPILKPMLQTLGRELETLAKEEHKHEPCTPEPSNKGLCEHMKTLSHPTTRLVETFRSLAINMEFVKLMIEATALNSYLEKAKMEWKKWEKEVCEVEAGKDVEDSQIVMEAEVGDPEL